MNLSFSMRKILIFIVLMIPFSIRAQMLEVSGIQAGLWNCDTVLVIGDVVVPEGSELVVAAGTKIVFDGHHNISVRGCFEAIGEESDYIYFTSCDTTGFYLCDRGKGGWNGLSFHDVENVRLSYCHFSYGKAADDVDCGGAVRMYNVENADVNNCIFYHNFTKGKGGALYAEGSGIRFSNCEVDGNLGYNNDGSYMHGAGFQFLRCDVVMEDMYFHDNYCSSCYGGGVNFDSCNVNVNKAVFEDNYAVNAAGMGIQRSNDYDVRVCNVLFDNNIAYHYGGAMATATSAPVIQNVTMTNNYTISAGGGAMQFFSEARPVFRNCIIWDNDWYDGATTITDGSQIFIWGSDCEPEFYSSILEGGYKEVHGNSNIKVYDTATMLDSDPMFVDVQSRDFSLSPESPAVNSGTVDTTGLMLPSTDLAGNHRIAGGRIDMGCYESDVTCIKELKSHKNINIYPNPLTIHSVCRFELKNTSEVCVKVYNQNGALVLAKGCGKMSAGMNEISLSDLMPILSRNNIYFLSVESQNETINTKFVY